MVQRFSITLTQLSYFAECAKTLNMTEASQELHIAQSAVSTAINQLEKALGAPLFVRQHSKGLVLTPAGESLLQETREIFGRISNAVESIQAGQNEVRGTIVIACFQTIAPFLLPQLLEKLEANYPELDVDIIEGDHDECMSALKSGRAELAINYDLSEAEGVRFQIVGEARPHVIVGTGHRLAKRKRISLSELADDDFVVLDLPGSREYFISLLRLMGVSASVRYRTSSYETVRSMVAMGLGFSILNQRPRIRETYTGERTAILEISDPVPTLHISLSMLSRSRPTAKAAAVMDTVKALLDESTTAG
jgi:DNA-binding transcriptional LysR family regulator